MKSLAGLIAGLAAGDVKHELRRLRRKTVLLTLAAVLGLTGCVAGLLALGLVLVPVLGAPGAAFFIAIVACATASLLVALMFAADSLERRHRRPSGRAVVARTALSVAPRLVRSGSPLSLLVAGGLGYLVADLVMDRSGSD